MLAATAPPTIAVSTTEQCRERYRGELVGVSAQQGLDVAHFVSAGAVSFARGVNDTPKLAALLLAAGAAGKGVGVPLVGAVIAASRYGLPVSTTHVTSGGLFGIGAVTGSARWKTIGQIVAAWLITLPLGAALAAVACLLLRVAG